MEKKAAKLKFEDCTDIIDLAIVRQRRKWQLDAINWFDYEDVSQIIRLHIYNKWHMWDQARPLEPWIGTIINNQIINQIRNHYGNYVKPCAKCEFSTGEGCSITSSKKQDNQCVLFRKWAKGKKAGMDLKITLSTENHAHELSSQPDNSIAYQEAIIKLNVRMKLELSGQHYKAYIMLFFEEADEEEVAQFMGYKTSEAKRKAGYRQVKNLKKKFKEKAAAILQEHDIINETD
jgi:DNA-directed RNA polymerase specialized sigma24 family protein